MSPEVKESIDALTAKVEQLADLFERQIGRKAGGQVRGWDAAARAVGRCAKTIKARHAREDFPEPIKWETIKLANGGKRRVPVWNRCDIEPFA